MRVLIVQKAEAREGRMIVRASVCVCVDFSYALIGGEAACVWVSVLEVMFALFARLTSVTSIDPSLCKPISAEWPNARAHPTTHPPKHTQSGLCCSGKNLLLLLYLLHYYPNTRRGGWPDWSFFFFLNCCRWIADMLYCQWSVHYVRPFAERTSKIRKEHLKIESADTSYMGL